ncbi:MAG: glycosyltransferase family 2 protein [Bacteroidota bacterium]|nr:glycosyltransferase family 2 protein [Bacteroidota bacterium]
MENVKQLSVVIITKNEEKNIERCLRSVLPIADDIVIVDSCSTDKTKELSERFKVRFFEKEWKGFAKTKNEANKLAKYDWIFSIDADEVLSTELQSSILKEKKSEEIFYYKINRLTNYCGKWIKYSGWYPDKKLRFFNRKHTKWVGEYVHEKLETKGIIPEIKLLDGHLYHFSFSSIAQHIDTINRFSSLSAQELFSKKIKANYFKLLFEPIYKFLKIYFFKTAFRDGFYGFVIAVISAYSRFLKQLKLFHLERSNNLSKNN